MSNALTEQVMSSQCESMKASIHPLIIQGRRFVDEKNFEEAIELLSGLLQTLVAKYGEVSIETARAYFEYGNALLTKVEDTPTEGILGSAADDAKATASIQKILSGPGDVSEVPEDDDSVGDDDSDDGKDNEDEDAAGPDEGQIDGSNNDPDGEQPPAAGDEEADDLQVAWELLEVARKIYEDNPGPDTDIRLSELYVRLGDVQRMNSLYDAAIEDYKKGLALCDAICKPSDRQYSSIHYALAVAYIYKSSQEGANKIEEKTRALEHYCKAKQSIAARLSELKSEGAVYRLEDILGPPDLDPIVTQTAATSTSSNTTSSSSSQSSSSALQLSPHTPAGRLAAHLADSQDLLDVLTESEEGLAAEIEELKKEANSSSTYGTTIGFGFGSNTSAIAPATNFFGSATSMSALSDGGDFFKSAAPISGNAVQGLAGENSNNFFSSVGPFSLAPNGLTILPDLANGPAVSSTLQVKRKVKYANVCGLDSGGAGDTEAAVKKVKID